MDEQLRDLGHAARAEAEAATDVDRAWTSFSDEITTGSRTAAVSESGGRAGRSPWPWLAVAATLVAAVAGLVLLGGDDNDAIQITDVPDTTLQVVTPTSPDTAPNSTVDTAQQPSTTAPSATTIGTTIAADDVGRTDTHHAGHYGYPDRVVARPGVGGVAYLAHLRAGLRLHPAPDRTRRHHGVVRPGRAGADPALDTAGDGRACPTPTARSGSNWSGRTTWSTSTSTRPLRTATASGPIWSRSRSPPVTPAARSIAGRASPIGSVTPTWWRPVKASSGSAVVAPTPCDRRRTPRSRCDGSLGTGATCPTPPAGSSRKHPRGARISVHDVPT